MTSDLQRPVVAATRNPDKLVRLGQLIGRRHRLRALADDVTFDEPDGDGESSRNSDPLVAIAAAKARAASSAMGGQLTIASDGGLVVPALGARWQPARTRRFAGPGATNRQRAEALLGLAADLTGDERRIVWREAVALDRNGRTLLTAVAKSRPGWLATDLSGWADDGQGFWLPRLWRREREAPQSAGSGDEHWDRLRVVVGPFLDGLSGDEVN